MIVLQTLMSFPEMTSLFKLGPLIINEAKSHHMVLSLVLPNAIFLEKIMNHLDQNCQKNDLR